jgi:hypothetical protein
MLSSSFQRKSGLPSRLRSHSSREKELRCEEGHQVNQKRQLKESQGIGEKERREWNKRRLTNRQNNNTKEGLSLHERRFPIQGLFIFLISFWFFPLRSLRVYTQRSHESENMVEREREREREESFFLLSLSSSSEVKCILYSLGINASLLSQPRKVVKRVSISFSLFLHTHYVLETSECNFLSKWKCVQI